MANTQSALNRILEDPVYYGKDSGYNLVDDVAAVREAIDERDQYDAYATKTEPFHVVKENIHLKARCEEHGIEFKDLLKGLG